MVVALLLVGPAFAEIDNSKHITINKNTIINKYTEVTEVTNVNINEEAELHAFDYGAYLDFIFFETESTEWGLKTSYTVENSETRAFLGGKIYLNRLFSKK